MMPAEEVLLVRAVMGRGEGRDDEAVGDGGVGELAPTLGMRDPLPV